MKLLMQDNCARYWR